MATKIPEPEETEMNMTPMIDIVFQLIIFFLLSLKFKSVDQRIQSELPKDRGIQATASMVDDLPTLKVKLFRRNMDNKAEAFTRVRVGNRDTFELAKGDWAGTEKSDETRQADQDVIKAKVIAAIQRIWQQEGNNPDIKGEIRTPPPFGQGVPHGHVIMVLDAFLEAGINDVTFQGAMPPVPRAGGGGIIQGG